MATFGEVKWRYLQTDIIAVGSPFKKATTYDLGNITVIQDFWHVVHWPVRLKGSAMWIGGRIFFAHPKPLSLIFTANMSVNGRFVVGQQYLLGWPYFWRRKGSGYFAVFTDTTEVSAVPVHVSAAGAVVSIRKVGPRIVVSPRDLVVHLHESRRSSAVKHRRQREKLIGPFVNHAPPMKLANPFIVKDWYWICNEYPGYYYAFQAQKQVYYKSWSSIKTPGFRSLKRRQLPVNPYSCVIIKTNDGQCFDLRSCVAPPNLVGDTNYWGKTSDLFSPPGAPVHDDALYNKAVSKCIDRAELQLDGNIAQDLVQANQTTSMIADSARRLAAAVTHVRHHDFVSAAKVLYHSPRFTRGQGFHGIPVNDRHIPSVKKSLADNWLALQYGWKPLLQDIQGSMRSLANAIVKDPNTVRTIRAKAESDVRTTSPIGLQSGWYQQTGLSSVETHSECTVGFRYTIESRLKSFLAQTGFTNPVNLAWEVLPYSFVVDWFLPIGPYLTTLSAYDGLAFQDGFVTKFTRQSTLASIQFTGGFPTNTSTTYWNVGGRYSREYILLNRTKLTTFPTLQRPTLKNPISTIHAMNALALLESAFGRG